MDTATITPVEAPATPPEAPVSIADHAAQFNPEGPREPVETGVPPAQTEQAPAGEPKRRHRQKDIATPADVPRIRELTGKVKDAETRAEKAEREAAEWRTKFESAQRPAPALAPAPVATAPKPAQPSGDKFTFPSFDAWLQNNPGGDYDAWSDAKLDARDAWREQQQTVRAQAEQSARQQSEAEQAERVKWETAKNTYQSKLSEFVKTHPDFTDRFNAAAQQVGNVAMPPVLLAALWTADNGPEQVYTLLARPDLLSEAYALWDGKTPTDSAVAFAQRWLSSRVQTGTTGSVAAAIPAKVLPTPPNPVRTTGTMTTGHEFPGEAQSIADHSRHYSPTRRR